MIFVECALILIIVHQLQCIILADSVGWPGLRGRSYIAAYGKYAVTGLCDQPPLG